jgi:hypothetical protein
VNVPVIIVKRVAGRLYPETWPNTPPEVTERLRGHVHLLRCREHLSYRAVVAAMLERYGERRSLGQVWKDVHYYECSRCSTAPRPAPPPDPRQRIQVHAWR